MGRVGTQAKPENSWVPPNWTPFINPHTFPGRAKAEHYCMDTQEQSWKNLTFLKTLLFNYFTETKKYSNVKIIFLTLNILILLVYQAVSIKSSNMLRNIALIVKAYKGNYSNAPDLKNFDIYPDPEMTPHLTLSFRTVKFFLVFI